MVIRPEDPNRSFLVSKEHLVILSFRVESNFGFFQWALRSWLAMNEEKKEMGTENV
jgi:hypothetical protein